MFRSMDYIYEVYKERSFTTAAKNLYISQPALSAAVKKTESKIGVELFDRSAAPIALTDAGRAYIEAAERIYAIQKDFLREIGDLEESRTGTLTVSAATLISSLLLPRIMMNYTKRYPGIRIEMTEGASAELHERLLDGSIELLLDYAFNDRDYTAFPLLEERILLAVPASMAINDRFRDASLTAADVRAGRHMEEDCPTVELKAFEDEPFLRLKKGNDMYDRTAAILAETRTVPRQVFQLDQLMTGYHAVKAGMGVALVTDTLPRFNPDGGKVLFYKIAADRTTRTLKLACKRGSYVSRAAEAFILTAQEYCRGELFENME